MSWTRKRHAREARLKRRKLTVSNFTTMVGEGQEEWERRREQGKHEPWFNMFVGRPRRIGTLWRHNLRFREYRQHLLNGSMYPLRHGRHEINAVYKTGIK